MVTTSKHILSSGQSTESVNPYFLHPGSIRHLQSGAAGCNKPCNKFYYRKLLHRPQRSLQPMADAIGPCFVENIIGWPRGAKG